MKKLLFLAASALMFALNFVGMSSDLTAFAIENKSYYAKVSDNAYFYSQSIDDKEYQTFKIPTGYFVLVTGESDSQFFICRYNDVMGYVKKDEVRVMDGTPKNPFVNNATFVIKSRNGIELRSSPYYLETNKLISLSFQENRLYFYGTCQGEEVVPDLTSTWYYCKFDSENKKQFGYVYEDDCYKLSNFDENVEEFPIVQNPIFSTGSGKQQTSSQLSGTAKTLIIIGVCLPCIVILYFLIKPTLLSENKREKTKRPKRKRKGDYYELDESDLN